MECTREELITLISKLNKLSKDKKEYIKGWLDGKLD